MNSLKRYRQNSQLFIRLKDWKRVTRFYEKWEKVHKEQTMLKQYTRDSRNLVSTPPSRETRKLT